MTTIRCIGGHDFYLRDPSPHEYRLISVVEIYERVVPMIMQIIEKGEDVDLRLMGIRLCGSTLYTCPICNRLIVIDNDGNAEWYRLEDNKPQ
jgi:hypothetical protein